MLTISSFFLQLILNRKAWNIAKELRLDGMANLLWEKMTEEGRQKGQLFLEQSNQKKPSSATKAKPQKLSAKLLEIQEAVRKGSGN